MLTTIAVFYASSSENQLRLVPLVTFLSIIKILNPNLFDQIHKQKISYSELTKKLGLEGITDDDENHGLFWIMSWIMFAMLTPDEFEQLPKDDELRNYGRELARYHVRREWLLPNFSQRLNSFVANK